MAEQARVTQAGAFVEYEGEPSVSVTQAGAFVEYEGEPAIFVTQVGAFIEYEEIPTSSSASGIYKTFLGSGSFR